MRIFKGVSLAVVLTALVLVVALKLSDRRSVPPHDESALLLDCVCMVPELSGDDGEARSIPPVPGLPTLLAFADDESEEALAAVEQISSLSGRLEDRVGVLVLDAHAHPEQAVYWRLRMVPTIIFLDDDGVEVCRREGPSEDDEILEGLREAGAEVE